MQRLLLAGLLAIGALGGSGERGTLAAFTSAAGSTGNTFTAGTVRIQTGVAAGTLSIGDLVPGDGLSGQLAIQNSGTLELRYAMVATVSGNAGLASALAATVSTCGPSPTRLYSGLLATARVGDPARGPDPGDRVLAPGASEPLCVGVSLPAGTPPSMEGASVTASFTFVAEQL